MQYRERVAHHEAAHMVLAVQIGAGIGDQGMDLNAPTSTEGAYGNATVMLLIHDASQTIEEQKEDLLRNLVIICAGAASDAKLMVRPLREALRRQPGDEKDARKLIAQSPLTEKNDEHTRREEEELLLNKALELAARQLEKPIVWKTIQEVARATLNEGGRLTKPQIEAIIETNLPSKADPE
jgi:hypothetical protein